MSFREGEAMLVVSFKTMLFTIKFLNSKCNLLNLTIYEHKVVLQEKYGVFVVKKVFYAVINTMNNIFASNGFPSCSC